METPREAPSAAAAAVWAALLAASLCCIGCEQPVTAEAKQLLSASRQAYDRGDDAAVIRDTSAFLKDHSKTKLADLAYYLRGLARYRRKELPAARTDLKFAAATAHRKDVRVGALKTLGDLAFEAGEMDWAAEVYGKGLAALAPNEKPADEMAFRLGCIHQRKGQWLLADRYFDRVVHLFAGTEAARRSERRLRCLAWCVQAGSFAGKAQADAEAARLRAQKLPAVTRPATADGALRFLVQVGYFKAYAEAAALLPAVRRHRPDAFTTPTR